MLHGYARVAQLVERDLAKVEAAGSSPVSRSFYLKAEIQCLLASPLFFSLKIWCIHLNTFEYTELKPLIFLCSSNLCCCDISHLSRLAIILTISTEPLQ